MTRSIDSQCRFHRPFRRFSSVALLVGLTGICAWHWPAVARGGDDPPGAYKAASPEPSAAETLILEYVNRCRLNPAEDALGCVQTEGVPRTVDSDMFKQEMLEAKPAPPLVFDLALLKAALAQLLPSPQQHDTRGGGREGGVYGQITFVQDKAGGLQPRTRWRKHYALWQNSLVLSCRLRY